MNTTNDIIDQEPVDRGRPRTSPIVWGALYLLFTAWITQRIFFPDSILTSTLWLTVTAIGLGVVLLGIGVAVAVRQRT